MDALALIPPNYKIEETDGFWIGRFSVCIAENAACTKDKRVREDLREILDEFTRNPVCTPGLRKALKEIR